MTTAYRGRLAPSPTGFLHLGHAATFWTAFQRARHFNGTLVLRNDDLDASRCRSEFVEAMIEDLRWFGISWSEGPDTPGLFGPYAQSDCQARYRDGWRKLREAGLIYPCTCSRRAVLAAAGAPHAGEEEPIYAGVCRPAQPGPVEDDGSAAACWRFRVPEGEEIFFQDGFQGRQSYIAGRDFGDFVVWRKDGVPAYQLATVLDDHAMAVTEVVRGADLLLSTARQILLYRALELPQPDFFHCPLVKDDQGQRLAKRHESLSLRSLRATGARPEDLRQQLPAVPVG